MWAETELARHLEVNVEEWKRVAGNLGGHNGRREGGHRDLMEVRQRGKTASLTEASIACRDCPARGLIPQLPTFAVVRVRGYGHARCDLMPFISESAGKTK